MTDRGGPGSQLRIEWLSGRALGPALADVARLRIEVFRAWPHLYDGTVDTEQRCLAEFAAAKDAIVVAARDGERIVGAATPAPGRDTSRQPGAAPLGQTVQVVSPD